MKERFIVTIDGPAGSGKSTLANLIAKRKGFLHIDTGALYRVIGCLLGENPRKDDLERLTLEVVKNSEIRILHNGRDIEEFIRSERCGMLASSVAKIGYVREYVNRFVRRMAEKGRYVIDGRDCGTVIFPDADLKLFLVASVEERARRRALEEGKDPEKIKKLIEERDRQDIERKIDPLIKADDAVEIDTTGMSSEDVFRLVNRLIEERLHADNNS